MKLKLVAAISALAISALAHAQQGGPQPNVLKPTKADAQNVVQIVTSDKVKTQAYCDLTKLYDQVEEAAQKNDNKTLETLNKQADALLHKLGPEYSKLMDGLEQVDPKSSEATEFMTILSELDKRCTN
jgi:ABC-type transporter Mla subunit MlaD